MFCISVCGLYEKQNTIGFLLQTSSYEGKKQEHAMLNACKKNVFPKTGQLKIQVKKFMIYLNCNSNMALTFPH